MVLPQVLALEDHEPNLLEQAEDSPLNHLNIGTQQTVQPFKHRYTAETATKQT